MKFNKTAAERALLEKLSTQELDALLQQELNREDIQDQKVRLLLQVLQEREEGPRKNAGRWRGPVKAAAVLLLAGALVLAAPRAARAEGFLQLLTGWTDSIFAFLQTDRQTEPAYVFRTDNPGLQQIYDAVTELGITDPVVPTWLPDGYVLTELTVFTEPSEMTLWAKMECENKVFCIFIGERSENEMLSYTKDMEAVDMYEREGIAHYILSNNEMVNAVWVQKDIECAVVADCREDIYKILKSIYTTEAQ